MDNSTQGARRPHIDTLRVVYGHAFVITATETIPAPKRLGADEPSPWLCYPAGRGA